MQGEPPPEAIDPRVAIIADDPRRSEIVAVAIQRPYSPSEFARDAGIDVGIAAYAFKVLREHNVLELVDVVKVRGANKHMYRANKAAFIGDKDWGALAPVLRPGIIGATVGNFNRRIAEAAETEKLYERDDVQVYWAPREYDEEAWGELTKILAWVIEEADQLAVDTFQRHAKRRADGKSAESFRTTVGLFLFPSPTHSEVKKAEREKRRKEREKQRAGKPRKGKAKAQLKTSRKPATKKAEGKRK